VKQITILGSTGSIGTNTLDVIRQHPDRFTVFALVAGSNADLLASQIREFRPKVASLATDSARLRLISILRDSGMPESDWPDLTIGPASRMNVAIAPEVDIVMSSIVGVSGLEATYEAVKRGKIVGLANKEVLVAAGSLVIEAARSHGPDRLLPVDSEHNGAHQCLRAGRHHEVRKLLLTASGGPFRNTPAEALQTVTPEQALKHPTWVMGPRITIDSSTLMNKGFEVIEACWLFDLPPSKVEVVVHPQSKIHAMVEYNDGSVIAQVSATDMRMPIQYALTYPDRWEAPVQPLDWASMGNWEFYPPDFRKFPLLKLAYQAMETGGSATATLNAADEIAVESFLRGEISYPRIAEVVEETLQQVPSRRPSSIAEVLDIDNQSRQVARSLARGELV